MRDKTLCKDIRKLSTQYQTSSIEPSTASVALLSTLLQRCMPFCIMAWSRSCHEFDIMQDIWKNMTLAGRFIMYRKYCFEPVPSGRLAKFCRTSAVIPVHTDFSRKSRRKVFNLMCSRSVERCGAGTPNTWAEAAIPVSLSRITCGLTTLSKTTAI